MEKQKLKRAIFFFVAFVLVYFYVIWFQSDGASCTYGNVHGRSIQIRWIFKSNWWLACILIDGNMKPAYKVTLNLRSTHTQTHLKLFKKKYKH